MMDDDIYFNCTIFGVTPENYKYIRAKLSENENLPLFSGYNLSSEGQNESFSIHRHLHSKHSGHKNTHSFKQETNYREIEVEDEDEPSNYSDESDSTDEDYSDSINSVTIGPLSPSSNWIYAKVSQDFFKKYGNRTKFTLKNNDVIYVIKGKYHDPSSNGFFSPQATPNEQQESQPQDNNTMIYKMPNVQNLSILSYESKPLYIKLREFIFGQYDIQSRNGEGDSFLSKACAFIERKVVPIINNKF